ncbi:YibE/F family protein [Terrabacter sp. MAHUQ-38]|uniref:YibE/F family protein n=1 Tax=unclassified Terrabacter TaxID=2630222 RepID=UPI00165E6FA0|nr:YibE/F family protein [Terrabacter sp. MAHUQ-38]MBC9823488.1 YibE/F family protein [Terrabacter sp. MAHUQ-38]
MPGGHAHSHAHGSDDAHAKVRVSALARVGLTLFLVLAAAATVFGVVRYWPGDARTPNQVRTTDFAAPGVTFPVAEVQKMLPPCEGADAGAGAKPAEGQGGDVAASDATCGAMTVQLEQPTATSGDVRPTVSVSVPPAISTSGLREGDTVQLLRIPAQDDQPEAYSFLQVQRGAPLSLMLALFLVVVAVVARWRGLLALVGLGFGGLVVVKFMLPALLDGQSGLLVALIGSSAIMFVVLYLAHGLSVRTSTALAGTLFGVAITAGLGLLAVDMARLSGVADDEGATLAAFITTMSPQELLTCAIIVAGLGVLNDVTITQSSAVWELRAAAPGMGRRELFHSGMRIGRDHIASTIYTIVFAYAGAALPVLLLLFLYDRPVLDLLQTESLSEEIVRTLASAIGLVLAVPATTAIAALTVGSAKAPKAAPRGDQPGEPGHSVPAGVAGVHGAGPSAADLVRAASGPPPPSTRAEARSRMSSS